MKTEKKCAKCKEVLPIENFAPHKTATDGRQYACRPCNRAYNRNHYHKTRKGEAGEEFAPAYTTIRASGYSKQEIADYYHTHTLKETRAYFKLSAYQVNLCYKELYGSKHQSPAARAEKAQGSPLERKLRRMKGRTYVYNCQFVHIKGFEVGPKQVIIQTDRRSLPLPLKKINYVLEREFLPMER
jgi:hypothetical protein